MSNDRGLGNRINTREEMINATSHCCKASVVNIITDYEYGWECVPTCTVCKQPVYKQKTDSDGSKSN